MKYFRKIASLFLITMLFVGMFSMLRSETEAKADVELGTPTFTLKRINNGTGIKITINKTQNADSYSIFFTKRDNKYNSYLTNNGDYRRKIADIQKNGKSKRTYTINGLPKGIYTFIVWAYDEEVTIDEDGYKSIEILSTTFSEEKSISVKAAKTSKSKVKNEKLYDFSNVNVGDTIIFGSYEQDDDMNNGTEDIEWIVLAKDGKRMLVLSKYALDNLPYNYHIDDHVHGGDTTWEKCSLRTWLNKEFYTSAFTKKERSMISKTKLKNVDNPEYGTQGGNDTKDKVFLLSYNDVYNSSYGFGDIDEDITRCCSPTNYAIAQGAVHKVVYNYDWDTDEYVSDGKEYCLWWLRDIGGSESDATSVDADGFTRIAGVGTYAAEVSVRPALVINLK